MKPLRVFTVVTDFGRHGANVTLRRFLEALDPSRVDMTLCTIAGPGLDYPQVKNLGFPIHLLNRSSKFDLGTMWQLRALIKKGAYDLVYTTKHSSAFLARPAAGWAGVPLLVHERGSPLQFVSPLVRIMDRLQSRGSHLMVTNSVYTKETACAFLGMDPSRVRVIYNPVPQVEPPPPREMTQGTHPTLGYFGRLTEAKGVDILLRAVAILKQSLPDIRAVVTGEGPLLDALQQLAADLEIQEAVAFHPWHDQVIPLMEEMDMVIVPSLYEPFGNVVTEAALAQTPVVAARVGGIPEILEAVGHGISVEPTVSLESSTGDSPFAARVKELRGNHLRALEPGHLAKAIQDLWDAPEKRESMVRESFSRVSQAFSLDCYVESMMNIMEEASKVENPHQGV